MKSIIKHFSVVFAALIVTGVTVPSAYTAHADETATQSENSQNPDNPSASKQIITNLDSLDISLSDSQYYEIAQELESGQKVIEIPDTNYVYYVQPDVPSVTTPTNGDGSPISPQSGIWGQPEGINWGHLGEILTGFEASYKGGKAFGKWMKSNHPTATSFLRKCGKNVFGIILIDSSNVSNAFYQGFLAGSK
ncbi:hypothetical protein [Lentilactobacillus parakefiri]|uniref:Uncharacterized protein n=1 Tax=Lentilactobacillus parakefiri TaxID=152332 RepID=A0A224VGQ6_9LACO|nr:hypothetical protein [Lentilactobacillus parakefiri]KRL61208.1 hypothetical protein FD08_GL003045 [Lentilactobacillus parakefiri DSM 10551]PAL00728.1 hypothetical protein B8W96_05095 [Lentilactobacillus parakefiri]TDG94453.1 hypothetical protein C5L28_001718 [Lentilactobacillus parakefiri]GAW71732.1 hypothetical protein LPKJCM_00835 [Lentilactobacillus parakefiri]